jgi:hypothetical protein
MIQLRAPVFLFFYPFAFDRLIMRSSMKIFSKMAYKKAGFICFYHHSQKEKGHFVLQ